MFGVGNSIDTLEQDLLACQRRHGELWARQVELLRELDLGQVATADGSRTMVEWVASRLDVSHPVARDLMFLAKAADSKVEDMLASGEVGLERAVLMTRLRLAGASDAEVTASLGYDLAGLERLVAARKRIAAADETATFADRYLVMQPNLDESAWKLWGLLAGLDGQLVEKALLQKADEFCPLPGEGRSQRMADALTSVCLDSLTGGSEGREVTVAEVFVDAALAAPSYGEAGVTLSSGLRAGPNTLAEILCSGRVRIIFAGDDGRPIGVSDLSEAVPPAVRSYVWSRDQGVCVIDGCRSRYRLQPHHIKERSQGGDHHPDNLALLCWFHHHVVIHDLGYRIDPESPPQRRRLIRHHNHGPPLS
ncbi:MAG TPA: HNH endonuclease [Acidimicrobiia bacterium]|nr:HNH endonuclease [Acidimicrobiia bacterium]